MDVRIDTNDDDDEVVEVIDNPPVHEPEVIEIEDDTPGERMGRELRSLQEDGFPIIGAQTRSTPRVTRSGHV